MRRPTAPRRNSTVRLGILRLSLAGFGCVGLIALVAAIYAVSVLFWGWVLMLVLGAVHSNWPHAVDAWSYRQCLFPWALLMPLVLG